MLSVNFIVMGSHGSICLVPTLLAILLSSFPEVKLRSNLCSLMDRLKNKLRSSSVTRKITVGAFVVLDNSERILELFENVAEDIDVPWLKTGIATLRAVLKMIQQSHANTKAVDELARRIVELTIMVRDTSEIRGANIPPMMQVRIDKLLAAWKQIDDDARHLKSRKPWVRVWTSDEDSKTIQSFTERLAWSMRSFMVDGLMAIEFALDDLSRLNEESFQSIERHIEDVRDDIQDLHVHLLDGKAVPPHAKRARYDSVHERRRCLEGTRTGVLGQIEAWILRQPVIGSAISCTTSSGTPIFWVNGLAGTGKTTIAYTVAEHCENEGILGASFFCSRDDTDCSNPSMIFNTIVYQLGIFYPPYKEHVSRALQKDPSIVFSSVPRQIDELLLAPLRFLRDAFPACIVVLDALDECRNADILVVVLLTLLERAEQLHPIRFLTTSRPETHIEKTFNHRSHKTTSSRLLLDRISLPIVTPDIKLYLTRALAETADAGFVLPRHWPGPLVIQILADRSEGLFIYAATSVKFVQDPRYNDPDGQLKRIVDALPNDPSRSLLDYLYLQILDAAFPKMSRGLSGRIKSILGSIVVLKDSLPPIDLARLLNTTVDNIYNSLIGLHSVLSIPQPDEFYISIRIIHPTFAEFLVSPTRCTNQSFLVNAKHQHTLLSRCCLEVMQDLKRDICSIRSPCVLNIEVQDLSDRVARCITPSLRYGCQQWAVHFEEGDVTDEHIVLLRDFVETKLLNWLEVCSLLGILRDALVALAIAQRKLLNMGEQLADIAGILHDCEKFVMRFFPTISTACLQIYHSCLFLAPTDTGLAQKYASQLRQVSVRVVDGVLESWDTCTGTIQHERGVEPREIAFSPDGLTVVTAGSDRRLHLWDAISCTPLLKCSGHEGEILSVTFSTNSRFIVSGSEDCTVRLWNVTTGVLEKTFTGHTHAVTSVGVTPDDTTIISGSADMSVKVWNIESGTCRTSLQQHQSRIGGIVISPNGRFVAAGTPQGPAHLWDTDKWALRYLPESDPDPWTHRHSSLVAFLDDSRQLLVHSSSSHIPGFTIWNVTTPAPLRMRTVRSPDIMNVDSIVFAPAAGVLVCSGHAGVFIADPRSGDILYRIIGEYLGGYYGERRFPMACNRDGTRIAFDDGNSVQVWAITRPERRAIRTGQYHLGRGEYTGVFFSHDVTVMIQWAFDPNVFHAKKNTFRVHAVDSTQSETLNIFRPVAFDASDRSIESTLVNSLFNSCIIPQWWWSFGRLGRSINRSIAPAADSAAQRSFLQVVTGLNLTCPFRGFAQHTMEDLKATLSLDGKYLISDTADQSLAPPYSVHLFNALTLSHIRSFWGHTEPITCLAFSLDDGTYIASASRDKTVRIWDTFTGAQLLFIASPAGMWQNVTTLSFSPDGKRIASGQEDGIVMLWSLADGAQIWSVQSPWESMAVGFSPLGDTVICCEQRFEDGAVCFFDTEDGSLSHQQDCEMWYSSLPISPDGSGIIVGTEDNPRTITLWDTSNASNPRNRATRSLPWWTPQVAWPVYYMVDDWVYGLYPTRNERLFRVPQQWGAIIGFLSHRYIFFQSCQILDVSALHEYLDSLN